MRGAVIALVVTSGCSAVFGLESPVRATDAALEDANADSSPPGGCTSFSTVVDTCELSLTGAYTLSVDVTFDTDTKVFTPTMASVPVVDITGPGGPILIPVADLTIPAGRTLRITGSRPVGIVAGGIITVEGLIDVGRGGAGARTACGSTSGEADTGGAGGGGGGGFAAIGGAGGNGDSDAPAVSQGGTGGVATPRPERPRGGCAGSPGGLGNSTGGVGAGGSGGGAVLLAARSKMALTGIIDAGGQGGGGGGQDGGGGGGGAGGMIILESPAVDLSGLLVANGGGGGEGAGVSDSGAAGQDGQRSLARATGGTGASPAGGTGGLGGAYFIPAGESAVVAPGGGGGGGGSVGYIAIAGTVSMVAGVVTSPAFTVWP